MIDPWLGLEVLGFAVGVWAGETDGGGCDDGWSRWWGIAAEAVKKGSGGVGSGGEG